MGAPKGHPFFGNQYTDGGYIIGSFNYVPEVIEKGVSVVKTVASEVSKGTSIKTANIVTSQQKSANLNLPVVEKVSSKWLNKNNIIIVGVLTVVTIGGILVYRYISKKNKDKKESEKSIELNVGLCVKCGKPLIESKYVPGSEINNHTDAHIICKKCGEKNFAVYPDNDESSNNNDDDKG